MAQKTNKAPAPKVMPEEAFAALGGGHLAYIRELSSEEATNLFPGVPPIAPGLKLWALLAADGTPIMLSDSRHAALSNAFEAELTTVSLH